MYSWSIVSNKHTSITRYDCIDLNFRQINTVIESLPLPCLRIVVLYHWHNKLFLKCCYRWVLILLVREYMVYLCTLVYLLPELFCCIINTFTKVQIIEKSWPIHYKKGPSNFIDMGPWAHTLLFLGNTLHWCNKYVILSQLILLNNNSLSIFPSVSRSLILSHLSIDSSSNPTKKRQCWRVKLGNLNTIELAMCVCVYHMC